MRILQQEDSVLGEIIIEKDTFLREEGQAAGWRFWQGQ